MPPSFISVCRCCPKTFVRKASNKPARLNQIPRLKKLKFSYSSKYSRNLVHCAIKCENASNVPSQAFHSTTKHSQHITQTQSNTQSINEHNTTSSNPELAQYDRFVKVLQMRCKISKEKIISNGNATY